MSLVYNNNKPIGKCDTYSIDKVPGTTPFVMLTNFELKQPQLNENQQQVLDWAKNYLTTIKDIAWFIDELAFLPTTGGKMRYKETAHIYESLSNTEKLSLLNVIIAWALEQEEE